jgi:hypothetical protein
MLDATLAASDSGIDHEQATEVLLLSQVATALLRLPFDGRTRGLHMRALQLRRRLDQSGPTMPSDDERRATRESILALRSEAASFLPSTPRRGATDRAPLRE